MLARRTEARWEFFSAWLPAAELLGSSPAAVSLASALLMKLLAPALPGSLPLLLASCYCVDIVQVNTDSIFKILSRAFAVVAVLYEELGPG